MVLWATAATLLIAAATAVLGARHVIPNRAPPARVAAGELTGSAATSAGKRTIVRLPDSSLVTLGPESTIRYAYTSTGRELTLDGMAEFQVTHDTLRRFTVRAAGAIVRDIGTEFVVRAYQGDSSIRVAVASGVVSLASAAAPESVIVLRARDVGGITRDASGRPAIVSNIDALLYTAWVDGHLAFDDQSLEQVAIELNRWFGVNVRVETPALAHRRVSGTYANPTLNHVLDALAASLGATYAKSNGSIVFRERHR